MRDELRLHRVGGGGKTTYVWMRWVSPTGEREPWGERAQATNLGVIALPRDVML